MKWRYFWLAIQLSGEIWHFYVRTKMFNFCINSDSGYIDVGDGCWRPDVLETSLRRWSPIKFIQKITIITKKVVNLMTLSPTSEINHHYIVTYITMSPIYFCDHGLLNQKCHQILESSPISVAIHTFRYISRQSFHWVAHLRFFQFHAKKSVKKHQFF